MFSKHFKLIESNPNSIYSSHSEIFFLMTILYYINPLVQFFCIQFSSITIIYFIIGVGSGSLTFLLPMSANCRPTSNQSILCILNFSPFLTKCILLAMCLVCLVSLPFLAMHIADLLSKTIKGYYFGTMSGSSFNNS